MDGFGVAVVDRQVQAKRRGIQGDAGFLEGFAHDRVEDALTLFQVPRWGSARVP